MLEGDGPRVGEEQFLWARLRCHGLLHVDGQAGILTVAEIDYIHQTLHVHIEANRPVGGGCSVGHVRKIVVNGDPVQLVRIGTRGERKVRRCGGRRRCDVFQRITRRFEAAVRDGVQLHLPGNCVAGHRDDGHISDLCIIGPVEGRRTRGQSQEIGDVNGLVAVAAAGFGRDGDAARLWTNVGNGLSDGVRRRIYNRHRIRAGVGDIELLAALAQNHSIRLCAH